MVAYLSVVNVRGSPVKSHLAARLGTPTGRPELAGRQSHSSVVSAVGTPTEPASSTHQTQKVGSAANRPLSSVRNWVWPAASCSWVTVTTGADSGSVAWADAFSTPSTSTVISTGPAWLLVMVRVSVGRAAEPWASRGMPGAAGARVQVKVGTFGSVVVSTHVQPAPLVSSSAAAAELTSTAYVPVVVPGSTVTGMTTWSTVPVAVASPIVTVGRTGTGVVVVELGVVVVVEDGVVVVVEDGVVVVVEDGVVVVVEDGVVDVVEEGVVLELLLVLELLVLELLVLEVLVLEVLEEDELDELEVLEAGAVGWVVVEDGVVLVGQTAGPVGADVGRVVGLAALVVVPAPAVAAGSVDAPPAGPPGAAPPSLEVWAPSVPRILGSWVAATTVRPATATSARATIPAGDAAIAASPAAPPPAPAPAAAAPAAAAPAAALACSRGEPVVDPAPAPATPTSVPTMAGTATQAALEAIAPRKMKGTMMAGRPRLTSAISYARLWA